MFKSTIESIFWIMPIVVVTIASTLQTTPNTQPTLLSPDSSKDVNTLQIARHFLNKLIFLFDYLMKILNNDGNAKKTYKSHLTNMEKAKIDGFVQ